MELIKIANYIRQISSPTYKERVGVLDEGADIGKLSNPLNEYQTTRNEFANGLINIMGNSILNRISNFENPLQMFKTGGKGLGIDTREIARGLVEGMDFDFSTDGIAKMFKIYPQEYAECFHRINRRRIFPITFSDKELKLALNSWEELETFINDLVVTLYESNYQEEYELMLELLRSSVQNDGVKAIEINPVLDSESGKDFVKVVKNVASGFNFRNNTNSTYGLKNPNTKIMPVCKKEDIALIIPYVVKNEISVDVLASAFNKDEVAFNAEHIVEVDSLGFIKQEGDLGETKYYAVDAIICDKNFFRVIDDPDNMVNGNDLPTARAYNRYLHIWQTLSTSPFMCANALVHEVSEDEIPEGYFDNLIEREALITD